MKRLMIIFTLMGVVGVAIFMMACRGQTTDRGAVTTAETAASVVVLETRSSTEASSSSVGEASEADADLSGELTDTSLGAELIQGISQEVSAEIRLDGLDVSVIGDGVMIDDQVLTITSAGTYTIQGEITDGRIVVDVGDDDEVTLVLDNAEIVCSTFSPIYVANADEVILFLTDGTENIVEDGETYILDSGVDEPDAAIFSHDDLTIVGSGSLTVIGNFNDGIQSKDDLLIESGDITIIAANDGLKGRNSITILDAVVTITAGGDGLQSNGTEDETQGIILIEDGTFRVEAGADGIQAATNLVINDGTFDLTTGGGRTAARKATGVVGDRRIRPRRPARQRARRG